MSNTLIKDNTEQLEEVLQMAESLPEVGSSSDPYQINPDLNLLVLGDSLFGKDAAKEFLQELGCNLQNYSVSGASLTEMSERRWPISVHGGAYNSVLEQFRRFKNGESPCLATGEDINTRLNGKSDFTKPDIILVDGGGNDFIEGAALGVHTYNPYTFEDTVPFNTNTVIGALETLLRDIAFTYPEAQRFFLIMHRAYYCSESDTRIAKTYWPTAQTYVRCLYERTVNGETVKTWELLLNQSYSKLVTLNHIKAATSLVTRTFSDTETQNNGQYVKPLLATDFDQDSLYKSGTHPGGTLDESKISWGYTYDELRENIIKVCNRYGFKIIDIYNDSLLNVVPPSTYTLKNGGTDKIPNTAYFDLSGLHPTLDGYRIGYAPYVKQALSLGTKK